MHPDGAGEVGLGRPPPIVVTHPDEGRFHALHPENAADIRALSGMCRGGACPRRKGRSRRCLSRAVTSPTSPANGIRGRPRARCRTRRATVPSLTIRLDWAVAAERPNLVGCGKSRGRKGRQWHHPTRRDALRTPIWVPGSGQKWRKRKKPGAPRQPLLWQEGNKPSGYSITVLCRAVFPRPLGALRKRGNPATSILTAGDCDTAKAA